MQGVFSKCLPGPVKQVTRAISKTIRAYRGNFRRLTDLVRTTVVFRRFADIQYFLERLHQRASYTTRELTPSSFRRTLRSHPEASPASSGHIMQIIRIRNRFDPSLSRKHLFGGYRDISLKIKMGFTCLQSNSAADRVKFVPLSRWGDPDVKRLVFEIQLHLEGMQLSSDASDSELHHQLYVESRDFLSV
jgi:hypothetical protein